jgi:hypothetical protein
MYTKSSVTVGAELYRETPRRIRRTNTHADDVVLIGAEHLNASGGSVPGIHTSLPAPS